MDSDPARDLNNFLQARKDANGNFSRYLSWVMEKDGPDDQKIHYATAKFRGQTIGYGRGTSMGRAKNVAAGQALQYLMSLPESHPLFSTP